MSTQFKISITKHIIDQAKHCDTENDMHEIGRNCAVARALKDIFPEVCITNYLIFPFGIDSNDENDVKIPLPVIAQQFIKLFDSLRLVPHLRPLLPEFEFTIDIPAEVINAINIDEIKELVRNNKESTNVVQII